MEENMYPSKEAESIIGYCGKMISGSKSTYRFYNPEHLVVFNANVVDAETGENLWYGDLDLTLESDKIKELAKKLGKTIVVLYEMDGRFDNALKPKIENAVLRTDGKTIAIGEKYTAYYEVRDSQFKAKGTFYKESQFPKAVKVNLLEFESNDPKVSPLFKLMEYVAHKAKKQPKGTLIDGAAIIMRTEDLEVLRWLTKNWLRKYHIKDKDDTFRTDKAYGWEMAFSEPREFGNDEPNWAKASTVYVNPEKLYVAAEKEAS
jgi:hypothetical protein